MPRDELLISVDVEASGPSPSTGSLIAIGACIVIRPDAGFYIELKPVEDTAWHADTEPIHGLTREYLATDGTEPRAAMERFAEWVAAVSGDRWPVFVGFNAPFDWMFVADYFQRYLGRNPFGVSALDLKALFMGRHGVRRWSDTTKQHVLEVLPGTLAHTHHALDDARMQAQLARQLLDLDEPRQHPPRHPSRRGPSGAAAD